MRPHGKYARVSTNNPEAFFQCDRCSFWYNRSEGLWQTGWAGQHIYNLQLLVCPRCFDIPNEQLRTIILPPDPPPIINARVPDYAYEEQTVRLTQLKTPGLGGPPQYPYGHGPQLMRATQFAGSTESGQARLLQYNTSS